MTLRFFLCPSVYRLGLFSIIKAAITPGIHPKSVSIKTISTEPHPLSMTARGGKMMERMTLNIDMCNTFKIENQDFFA